MELDEIRDLSESNKLDVVVQQSNDNDWVIKFTKESGEESLLHSTDTQTPRLFKTTDACMGFCSSVGVKTLVIKW